VLLRLPVLLICSIPLVAQVPPAAAKSAIEGRVVTIAGAPLKKAEITLRPQSGATPYAASSGADGRFAFHDLPADTYVLSVSRVGFVDQVYQAKSLKLDAGQTIDGVEVHLTPQGMIAGKTIDEDGDPIANLSITLQRWTYANGARRLVHAGYATSQADGSYVVANLAAGRYVIGASFMIRGNDRVIENADRNPRESNLPTFYPNVLDIRSAVPVAVAAGAELRGIDIRMRRGRAYEIRGRLQSASAVASWLAVPVSLWLKGEDQAAAIPRFTMATAKSNEFQFKNLIPGTYVIRVVIPKEAKDDGTQASGLLGEIEVTLSDANVDNAVIPLSGGIEITGAIKADGDPPKSPPHWRPVFHLVNPVVAYAADSVENGEDGSFHARGLMPELYRVMVLDLPDGSYVKGMRFDGQEISGTTLDLSPGNGGELQILVSPDAAEVTGVVRNGSGDAASTAMVQLFDDRRMVADSIVDSKGAFHLRNLAPGSYRIFAWEDASSGVTQDPEFRKQFEAMELKLAEKSNENIELKLVSKAAIDKAAAQVQ
jgi:hypothetical protein